MQSWKDCFTFFNSKFFELINASKNEGHNQELLDEATLQLAVYLASFGMYRNQFFLQSNRRILLPVIKSIFRKLDGNVPEERLSVDLIGELMFEAKRSITESFQNIKTLINNKEVIVSTGVANSMDEFLSATDTVVTKILMGINAYVPACDTNYRLAVKYLNRKLEDKNKLPLKITKDNIKEILSFVEVNRSFFEPCCECLGVNYEKNKPVMRVFDLYMWQLGFVENERERSDRKKKKKAGKKVKQGNFDKNCKKSKVVRGGVCK